MILYYTHDKDLLCCSPSCELNKQSNYRWFETPWRLCDVISCDNTVSHLIIHRSPVNSPHKGQWRGASMFSLICAWINGWANNREAGDLRRLRAHYDVTVVSAQDFHEGAARKTTVAVLSAIWICKQGPIGLYAHSFVLLYARLKNGRIMLWQCPSVCPSVRPSVRVFRTFFQRALRYRFETWYMHSVGGTTCRVWVSSQLGQFDLVYSQK